MNEVESSLDVSRIEKIRYHACGKVTGRCPACAAEGRDRSGNHLAIFPDGRFACAAFPGDGEHRRVIFSNLGKHSDTFTPSREVQREYRKRQERERRRNLARDEVTRAARQHRQGIVARHPWGLSDVRHDSPQRIDCDLIEFSPSYLLFSLFPASALLWTGEVYDSGKLHHSRCWKSCEEWQATADPVGPMTTPAIWKSGTYSRIAGSVLAAPFTVLDFDGVDGFAPTTAEQIDRHILESLSLVHWLREKMHWQLAAILWTGGKSIHAWFHTPPPKVLASLSEVATALGIDAGLIGRPEHPCRLPGQTHAKTGKTSRVLWLQEPGGAP